MVLLTTLTERCHRTTGSSGSQLVGDGVHPVDVGGTARCLAAVPGARSAGARPRTLRYAGREPVGPSRARDLHDPAPAAEQYLLTGLFHEVGL